MALPTLLILQLDSDKLRADGLSLAPLASSVAQFCLARSTIVEATDISDLCAQLGQLAAEGRSFDVILVIGHSRDDGIQVAKNHFEPWANFAKYLKPFSPRRLLMIACQAGRWRAADTFFTKLPTLCRIYASPVNATRKVGELLIALLPLAMVVKAPKGAHLLGLQAALVALSGVQVRHWQRGRDKGNPDGVALDVIAQVIDPVARLLPGWLQGRR